MKIGCLMFKTKYRIIQFGSTFIPQYRYRVLPWLWNNYYRCGAIDYSERVEFDTRKQAEQYIDINNQVIHEYKEK